MLGVSIMQRAPSSLNTGYNRQVMGYSGVLQFQGELPSVLGSSLDELMRHVSSLRTQVLEVAISIFDTLCQLGSTSPHAGPEQGSQVWSLSTAPTFVVARRAWLACDCWHTFL